MRAYSRNGEKGWAEEIPLKEQGEAEGDYAQVPLLTMGEAARYLGVSRNILYQILERGRITAVKAGRTTLVEKKSLDEFRAAGMLT